MSCRATYNYITLILSLLCCTVASAQQFDEYDYRNYKFYDEEEVEPLYPTVDTPYYNNSANGYFSDPLTRIRYALATVENPRRGSDYGEERYVVDYLGVDYSTARILRSAGLYSEIGAGIGHSSYSGGIALATRYTLATDAERCYNQQFLRGEFSGKGYLGGISYSATFTPQNRPALDSDWCARVYTRARAGRDIYVDGVYSYVADIAALLSRTRRNNSLGIALLLPASERGLRRASVEEAYTLTADPRYNPSWGMQSGRMRNSRVATTLRPELLVSWQQRLSAATTLHLTADLYYEFGGNTALAWFDAMTPEPDNYRYLPSYQRDKASRREVEEAWRRNDLRYTQLDWEAMYHTNALQRNGKAAYIVENRRNNRLHGALNTLFESRLQDITLRYGLKAMWHSDREFKVVDDLLGADYVEDMDYFLIDDDTYSSRTRNNLRDDNEITHEGERFGYDYMLTRRSLSLYGGLEWHNEQMSTSATLRIGGEQSLRHGFFEKELFAGNGSYGRSAVVSLAPYLVNAQWSYLLERHTLRAAVMMRGESPALEDLFLQKQYNNRTVDSPSLCHTAAAEFTYSYIGNILSLTATAFCNYDFGASEVLHYYDDLAGEYADVVISDIDRLNIGLELSSDIRYCRTLSSTFALTTTLGRYADDANVDIYADTDNRLLASTTALMQGTWTTTPAITLYGDVEYHTTNGWSATLSASYWGLRHIEPSAPRRSLRTLSYASSPEERAALMHQERLADAVMVDIGAGKIFKFRTGERLYVRLSLRNILGSQIIARGYEQNRISRSTIGGQLYISPFANRLTYAYPRMIYLSVGFRF